MGEINDETFRADVETSSLKVILRDFDMAALDAKERLLRTLAQDTERAWPHPSRTRRIRDSMWSR